MSCASWLTLSSKMPSLISSVLYICSAVIRRICTHKTCTGETPKIHAETRSKPIKTQAIKQKQICERLRDTKHTTINGNQRKRNTKNYDRNSLHAFLPLGTDGRAAAPAFSARHHEPMRTTATTRSCNTKSVQASETPTNTTMQQKQAEPKQANEITGLHVDRSHKLDDVVRFRHFAQHSNVKIRGERGAATR